MRLAEIKQEIVRMTEQERDELDAFMRQVRRWNTPERLAELDRRMREMDAGKKHPEEDLEALHQRLIEEGR